MIDGIKQEANQRPRFKSCQRTKDYLIDSNKDVEDETRRGIPILNADYVRNLSGSTKMYKRTR